MEKKCKGCQEIKPFNEFHLRTASNDGMDAQCKECRSRVNKSDGLKLKDYRENIHNYKKIGKPCEEILEAMGFELYNDDNPVYQQFNRRIATKYNFK